MSRRVAARMVNFACRRSQRLSGLTLHCRSVERFGEVVDLFLKRRKLLAEFGDFFIALCESVLDFLSWRLEFRQTLAGIQGDAERAYLETTVRANQRLELG